MIEKYSNRNFEAKNIQVYKDGYNNGLSKKKKAKKILESFENPDGTRRESSIEQTIRLLLDSMNLFYTQEFPVKGQLTPNGPEYYKQYDFMVTDGSQYKFLIEVHGDYFHYLEHQVNDKALSKGTKLQQKNVKNDHIKEKLAASKGLPLMIIWESEIKTNLGSVKNKIQDMISSFI